MEVVRSIYRILVGNSEGKGSLRNPGLDGRMLLKWIENT
jgi:hypothetical protein